MAREFLLVLTCCLVAFIALFLFNSVFDDLPDFMRHPGHAGGGRAEVVLYFLLLQPANMSNILPMSVLLASCFVISRMGRYHELSAMRAAGIDAVRMALPIWLVAGLLCVGSFWISESVAPQCTTKATRIYEARTESPERLRRQAKLVYHNAQGRRDWFFEEFRDSGVHTGVFIKQFTTDDAIEWELQAASAEYRGGHWRFGDCRVVPFDPVTQLPVEEAQHQYSSYEPPGLDETPDRIVNHVRPIEVLSARGIRATLAANPDLPAHVARSLLATFWFRLSASLSCLVGALFGVGLSITRERGSAMRGFAYAVGLMVAFYVIGEVGLVLARKGIIPVLVGSCLPTLGFVVAGMAVVRQRR